MRGVTTATSMRTWAKSIRLDYSYYSFWLVVVSIRCCISLRHVTLRLTLGYILTSFEQNWHQWGERGRGGQAMVSMDRKDATDEPCE
jgi:hypothetical protein